MLSDSTGRSFLVSALDKISLFAHKLGIRIFSGQGKVQIQAQANEMELIAEQDVHIISTKKSLYLTAEKEIVLRVGGTYLCLNPAGIEMGTSGRWEAHASHHAMVGPATMGSPRIDLPRGSINFNDSYICD